MTLSTVDDAFATGDFPGLGGCNSTHCRLRFHFLRSFGVDANHQSNIDVAFRILTVDGPHLATDANPEGWLNHDMDMSIINRAVQLSITNTAMTETPSAPFFHIDSLVEDIGMHQTNIHSNYGVNYSITNACKRPLLYFLDEDFNIVHNEQYELNEHGAQNYYFDARRRHVFDKAGIYYAMADCCEDCRPNGGSYDADMAVPPRSNVVQFVVLGDLDGDGIFDHEDPDKDNDGVCNKAEAVEGVCTAGPDAFPEEKSQWTDSDGDGVGDNLDGCDIYFEADEEAPDACVGDLFPDDPTEWGDLDEDGIGDNSDDDDDNDGLSDVDELTVYNSSPYNIDSDQDGLKDNEEVNLWIALTDSTTGIIDSDGDGLHNMIDRDSDNDGIKDGDELFPEADIDNDGYPNIIDADSDGDYLMDSVDQAPLANFINDNNIQGDNGGGGSPGWGGGGFVGGDNNGPPVPNLTTSGWSKYHPKGFYKKEYEFVTGFIEGESAILNWECEWYDWDDCEFSSYERGCSCEDTIGSNLNGVSKADKAWEVISERVGDANLICEEEDFYQMFNSGFPAFETYSYSTNVDEWHERQYRFDYQMEWQQYHSTCATKPYAEIEDKDGNPYWFQINKLKLDGNTNTWLPYQIELAKAMTYLITGPLSKCQL